MLEKLFIDNLWLAIAVWAAIYAADYYVTIGTARLYQMYAKQHFVFEGSFELTPFFQKDVDRLRRFSPRFLLLLALSLFVILAVWLLVVWTGVSPEMFSLLIGGLVLRSAVVHMRHIRNAVIFWYAKRAEGLSGRIEYARWLSLRVLSVEFFSFAALWLLAFLVSGSWFFAGGALYCAVEGFRQLYWASKARRSREQAEINAAVGDTG